MSSTAPQIRPLLRVALPVAVAAVLVVLAIINIVLVKVWHGEAEDGVLWQKEGANVVANLSGTDHLTLLGVHAEQLHDDNFVRAGLLV